MSGADLALILSPLCTVAVAFVGRARLQTVEARVDGHLDALNGEVAALKVALTAARLAPAEAPAVDTVRREA